MEITPRTTRLVRVELRRQRPRLQVLQNSFRPFVRGETTMNVTTRDLGVVLTELEAVPPPSGDGHKPARRTRIPLVVVFPPLSLANSICVEKSASEQQVVSPRLNDTMALRTNISNREKS